MKTTKAIFLLIVSLSFNGCISQNQKETKNLLSFNHFFQNNKDTAKPEIKINVNKQHDSYGNVIKYDSTYSYFYSVPDGIMENISNDTVYKKFHSFFDENYHNILKPKQDPIFSNDSLFKNNFFNNDYFYKRFEKNYQLFEDMFQSMDLIKADYLMNLYPNGYQHKKLFK